MYRLIRTIIIIAYTKGKGVSHKNTTTTKYNKQTRLQNSTSDTKILIKTPVIIQ